MTVIVCVIGLCDKLQGTTRREALSSYSSSSSSGGGDDDDLDEMGITTAKKHAIWTDDLER